MSDLQIRELQKLNASNSLTTHETSLIIGGNASTDAIRYDLLNAAHDNVTSTGGGKDRVEVLNGGDNLIYDFDGGDEIIGSRQNATVIGG